MYKKEKVTPFFATFSFVLFLYFMMLESKDILTPLISDCYVLCTLAILIYCPWVPVPPEVFSEVPSDPIASSALCAEYAACVPG